MGGPLSDLTPQQVAAAVLVGLGEDIGAQLCRHLDGEETQLVARAITEMREVGHQLAMHALETVHQRIVAGDYVEIGGPEYARGLLTKVVGPHRANHFVDRTVYPTESGFSMLNRVEADQIAPFISNEHPQTIALILSQLEPRKSAGVLTQLPERLQADVSYRMATTENVPQKVIADVEEALEVSLRDLLGRDQDVGGTQGSGRRAEFDGLKCGADRAQPDGRAGTRGGRRGAQPDVRLRRHWQDERSRNPASAA